MEATTDRISGLPDNLLHSILLLLLDTAEAARTSALARHWRHVWTHLPELSFIGLANVDAALAAYAAPTVNSIEFSMRPGSSRVPSSERLSSLLHFASQRLAGELWLTLRSVEGYHDVVLPVCERATAIYIDFLGVRNKLQFQIPPAGTFSVLATMTLMHVRLDGHELEGVLSTGCPRLKELTLQWITLVNGACALTIRSNSLERLQGIIIDIKVEVVAPELKSLGSSVVFEFNIVDSPKLVEVDWSYNPFDYDSSCHCFGVPRGHLLQRLAIRTTFFPVQLMQHFHTVDELDMSIRIQEGIDGYQKFLEDTKMLSKCCVALVVRLSSVEHALKPILLCLLRKCASIRKLVVKPSTIVDDHGCKPESGCPCSLLEMNCKKTTFCCMRLKK